MSGPLSAKAADERHGDDEDWARCRARRAALASDPDVVTEECTGEPGQEGADTGTINSL